MFYNITGTKAKVINVTESLVQQQELLIDVRGTKANELLINVISTKARICD